MNRTIPTAVAFLLMALSPLTAQEVLTPMQTSGYATITSYPEIETFVEKLDRISDVLTVERAGMTVQGRSLFALKFSTSVFGQDPSKIKILIFAQQHGNEPSGKEGALMLAADLIRAENRYLLNQADILIIPQMNPDGAEAGKRRNWNDADLNRNHLILTEPETRALHRLFDRYQFEVTLDVHEYYPFGESWKQYGFRSNTDELLGCATNTNVSKQIRDLQHTDFYPYLMRYCSDRKVPLFMYSPGGPPEADYIRHSTFDINDGRQSFAIQQSFSFILEGMNAEGEATERIQQRARGQMTAMRGLIEYACENREKLISLVHAERKRAIRPIPGGKVDIQSEHAATGETLKLPVFSYATHHDTVVTVKNYRPLVKPLYAVVRPSGYLIPKRLDQVVDWIGRQGLTSGAPEIKPGDHVEEYIIDSIDSIDFEGDRVVDPVVQVQPVQPGLTWDDYLYVPVDQAKGIMTVIALEPKSMLGLVTYPLFAGMLKIGKYPILRVIKK
jgi:hypothetical protein